MASANETGQGLGIQDPTDTVVEQGSLQCEAAITHAGSPMCRAPTLPTRRDPTTTSPPLTASTSQASRFSGGVDPPTSLKAATPKHGNASQASVLPKLGNLHKRRASASPEKFNTGKFEPLPLRLETPAENVERPRKRGRIENKIEFTYDGNGAPRIASITPTLTLPSGRTVSATHLLNRQRPAPSTKNKAFSVLNAIYRHNDLLLLFVSYLNLPSLISLYSISKLFHYLFNRHPTAFILSNMRTWAPRADEIYPWRCYQSLCVKDPVLRQKSQWQGQDANLDAKRTHCDLRDVPSLRWLQMVIWREGVCKDMLIQLATKGLRCPRGTLDAVKRMWFIMDLPLNAHRIVLCRSQEYITNDVLFKSTAFFLKVDMFFTNPAGPIYPFIGPGQQPSAAGYPRRWEMHGFVGCDLRALLLAERNLTPLWRVLRGMSWDPNEPMDVHMDRLDILRLYIRHKYHLPDDAPAQAKRQSIMGIPWWEVGTAGLERTSVSTFNLNGKQCTFVNPGLSGPDAKQHAAQQLLYPHRKRIILPALKPREPLLRPEQLMLREGIRRELEVHKLWSSMMLWGFSDDMGRALPLRTEEELLRWSKGKRPLHPFKTDEQVLKEREAERVRKVMVEMAREEIGVEGGEKGGGEGEKMRVETPYTAKTAGLPPFA